MGRLRHFERVRALVSGHSGVPEAEITPETRLVEDLGMDGDDGHEFLEGFADEFQADLGGMAPLNYFGDEVSFGGLSPIVPVIDAFSPRFRSYARHAVRGRRILTVRSLVASARAQRWITPETRPEDADPTRGGGGLLVLACAVAAGTVFLGFPATAVLLLCVLPFLALNLWYSLGLLRRLDAAATYEEQHLTAER
jgi:hypothetical protein